MIPTGNDTETAKAYYNYLYAHYIHSIPVPRTDILWSGPFWIAFWAFTLIMFFYFYSKNLQNVHRKQGEMYGAASFAGSILERIGPLSLFTWLISAFIIAVSVYYIVYQIMNGMIY